MFKKFISKVLTIVLVVAIFAMIVPASVFAATRDNTQTVTTSTAYANKIVIDQNALSSQSLEFLKKLQTDGLLKEFVITNGNLALAIPIPVLKIKYHLSSSDIQKIQAMITFSQQKGAENKTYPNIPRSTINPELSTRGSTLYFTHDDIGLLLITAAFIGPEAISVALTAIASLFSGPIGAAIGTILSVITLIGLPSLSKFCYTTIRAWFNDQGVYIGLHRDGWWPYITSGTW